MPGRIARVFPWLPGSPELNPHSFMFQEHEMDNSFLYTGQDVVLLPEGWLCLGWADGSQIPVRPKPGTLAVRFSDESGREFWCHVL